MNALFSPFSSSLLNSIKSVNVTGKTIPTTNLVMTEYIFEYRTSFRASFSAERGTYIHTYNFICFSRLQKKAAYADVDLLKTYLKYLQHLIA